MKVIKDYSPVVTGFEVKKGDSMMKPKYREKELRRLKLLKTQEHLFAIARVFIENDWMDKKITFDPFLSMEVIYEDDTTIKYGITSKFKEVLDVLPSTDVVPEYKPMDKYTRMEYLVALAEEPEFKGIDFTRIMLDGT